MHDPAAPGWPDVGRRTDSEAEAEAWAPAYLDSLPAGPRPVDPETLAEAVKEYLEHRKGAVERATWSSDRTATGHLLDRLGSSRRLDSIDKRDLQRIVDSLLASGFQPSTIRTYVGQWGPFFEWWGWSMPRLKVTSRVDAPPNEIEVLTEAEIVKLFEAARKVDGQKIGQFPSAVLACGIGLYMGLRQGEIFALRWSDIDTEKRTVRVRWQVPKDSTDLRPTKGKLARAALILPGWWELHRTDAVGFMVGRKGRPVSTRTQRNLITRTLDTAGLNAAGRGWHVLRHTYAVAFLDAGGTLEELQRSFGHASITTTARYDHWKSEQAAAKASARIYGPK